MKIASLCLVGDDLINGLKRDVNTNFLIKFLHRFSISVRQVNVCGDSKTDIAKFVQNASKSSDIVIISGGTGQKHAVQTFEAIAESLNLKLVQNNASDEINRGHLMLPENATILNYTPESLPIIKVENVFLLPGCPKSLRSCLNRLHEHFLSISETLIFTRYLHVQSNLIQIQQFIDNVANMFRTVKLCSIACAEKSCYKIILESQILKDVLSAENFTKRQFKDYGLKEDLPCNIVPIYEFARISHIFLESIQVLEKCISIYKPEEIFLSFNGGKDCTVLLHLAITVFNNKYLFDCNKPKIQCIYIQSEDEEPFEEIIQFIEETMNSYNLSLIKIKGTIQEALEKILKEDSRYKAVLMGTRRSDPFSDKLQHFQMTDENWPQIMRVSPILDWNYSDVWEYLHDLQIPYCSLYDAGYTSLGHKNNTVFNSALKTATGYLPAYLLEDGSLEREGRIKNNATSS